MTKEVTRRNFLTFAGVGALALGLTGCGGNPTVSDGSAGAATTGSSTDPYLQFDIPGKLSMAEFEDSAAIPTPITSFASEETYDVVVIGAGVGGIPTAIAAAEAGASVCLLQKESTAVGQGTGGAFVVPETTDEVGLSRFAREIHNYCELRSSLPLNEKWVKNSAEAIRWYVQKCNEAGMAEVSAEGQIFEFAVGDRTVQTQMITGYSGGMHTLCVGLAEHFGASVNIHYNTPGVQLIKEGDRIVGVYAQTADGSIIRVNANKGVIIATGDYQNNAAMVQKYVPDCQGFDRKQFNKTGDGQLMGMMVGGRMQNIGHTKMVHAKNWGANATTLRNTSFMAVNLNGERFTPEDIPMYYRNNAVVRQPENVWLTIMDADYEEKAYAIGLDQARNIPSLEDLEAIGEEGGVYKADTLEELAGKLGVPAAALIASVERYNSFCDTGDADFGVPAEYMSKIEKAPFYGLHREFAVSAITSGLEINANSEVLDQDRQPIAGLYAVGNCSGPYYGCIDYPAEVAGMSASRCITFGYLTGRAVAGM